MEVLTFAQVTDSLAVHGGTMFIDIGHQELTKMSNDRPADTVIRYPFDDRLGLDVTKLFKGDLLQTIHEHATENEAKTIRPYIFNAIEII
jgi:hypothetical protein